MKKRQIDKIKALDESVFEKKIGDMAKKGDLDGIMDDCLGRLLDEMEPADVSPDEKRRFYQTVKKTSHEKLLREARKKTPASDLPFGRYLQRIRDNSGLSEADIANLLNRDRADIARIESGQLSPLELAAGEMADIMQLFRLNLTELKTTIAAFLDFAAGKKGRISAMARSSGKIASDEKGAKFEYARDAALQAIRKKKAPQTPAKTIEHGYIDAVKKEMTRRKDEDLLV